MLLQIPEKCGSGFGIGQWAVTRRVFKSVVEKAYITFKRLFIEKLTLLVKTQKEVRSTFEKT